MRICVIAGASLLLLAASPAPAVIMAEHVGAADPTTEMAAYWRAETHPYYNWREAPITGGSPGAGSIPNWHMVQNAGGYYYTHQIHKPSESDPQYQFHQFLASEGWTATILVKVNYAHSRGHANIFFLEDGASIIDLSVVNNPGYTTNNGLQIRYWTGGSSDYEVIDPTATASDWTLFNIVCDAKDNTDPSDDELSIYVNGNLVNTYSRSYFEPFTATTKMFSFGRMAEAAYTSDQQYALWRLETGETLPFPVAGDVDGDLWVGNKDVNLIIEHWGSTTYPDGDLNDDGVVDMDDYQIVIDNWGTGFRPPEAIVSQALPASPERPVYATASLFLLLGCPLLWSVGRCKKASLGTILVIVLCCGQFAYAAGEFTMVPPGRGNAAASWGDYDKDGDPDLYSGAGLWNNTGANPVGWSSAGNWGDAVHTLWGDIDNDGWLDFYSSLENKVYMNTGGSISTTGVALSGVTSTDNAKVGPCFADFDNNGFIDLYIASHYQYGAAQPDALLMNSGSGWTTTGEEGALDDALPISTVYEGRGATACDFDRDGDQDIYVSNYGGSSGMRQANYLWINDGFGVFSESAGDYGAAGWDAGTSTYQWSIGSVWADFDNDGEFDLLAGSFNHDGTAGEPRVQFLKNNGATGNPATAYHFTHQGHGNVLGAVQYAAPAAGDYDNDGDLDLYYSVMTYAGGVGQSALYRNDGNFNFTLVSGSGLETVNPNLQGAWADYDNDGDVDIMANAAPHRNNLSNANHYLKVKLVGNGATVNSEAIGAQVRISVDHDDNPGTADIIVTRQVEAGTGSGGNQNDMTLHFGLGQESGPVDLNITWPDGKLQTIQGVAVDSLYIVDNRLRLDIVDVAGAPAGYTAYDIVADASSKAGPMEMHIRTDIAAGIYHVSLADEPDVAAAAFDTYVTVGTVENPTGANPASTAVLGYAEAIGPLDPNYTTTDAVFEEDHISIAWAWDPRGVVDLDDFGAFAARWKNGTAGLEDLAILAAHWLDTNSLGSGEYQVARIVLSDAANASLTLLGMQTGTGDFFIMRKTFDAGP